MINTCSRCARLNPPEAQYCYFDGVVLRSHLPSKGPVNMGAQPFPRAFVFPGGRQCNNFDQLALACQDDGVSAMKLVQSGDLPNFLAAIGRTDLAHAARDVLKAPNRAVGFDAFLASLPSTVLQPPLLAVEPSTINFGDLQVGSNHSVSVRLANRGMRLVHGNMYCEDAPWLSIGAANGVKEKLFQFSNEQALQLIVQGDRLSAAPKPLQGQVHFRSSGGDATLLVRANVPVKPFPEGVLQGCVSPRQIAEGAKSHPREAAEFFENGAVEKWYRANGWNYPVRGPSSSGLGAIQQFFEALGLARAPRVQLSVTHVTLRGKPGMTLRQLIEVRTLEKRNVFAVGRSDQPWLKVHCDQPRGNIAPVLLEVPEVPDEPGETLHAIAVIHSNGNQRFELPVELIIAGIPRAKPLPESPIDRIAAAPSGNHQSVQAAPATVSPWAPEARAIAAAPLPMEIDKGSQSKGRSSPLPRHLAPLILLLTILMCFLLHDLFFVKPAGVTQALSEEETINPDPLIGINMHHELGKNLATGEDEILPYATERFGLVMLKEPDPTGKTRYKRLTFDQDGRTNNTCIRLDGTGAGHEFLFGHPEGRWLDKEKLVALGQDSERERHSGYRSAWALLNGRIVIKQSVELLAGGARPGTNTRYYDTCLVTYKIENKDARAHNVGLRFMLDTFIGSNDGVPFTLPGSSELCDTSRTFDDAARVPDFIEARERSDFADPGTIAHLQLRLGKKYVAPSRVTLGAWPNRELETKERVKGGFDSYMTMWDVPVRSIKAIQAIDKDLPPDSCVVMYWPEQDLRPGDSRELGFAYGLGSLASDKEGQLGLTVPGMAVRGDEFTVTALVKRPIKGQTVTLKLPDGMELSSSEKEQVVPSPSEGKVDSPVTWKVRATTSGRFEIEVTTSTGGSVPKKIRIRDKDIFN